MDYTHHIRTTSLIGTVWTPVAFANDTPGRVKGIGVAASDRTEQFARILLDDSKIAEEKICGARNYGNIGMNLDLPFKNEMEVKCKNNDPTSKTRIWVSFVTTDTKEEL